MMGYGYGGGGLLWMLVMAALVAIFPPAGLILLWVVAFREKLGSGA